MTLLPWQLRRLLSVVILEPCPPPPDDFAGTELVIQVLNLLRVAQALLCTGRWKHQGCARARLKAST